MSGVLTADGYELELIFRCNFLHFTGVLLAFLLCAM